ncbi:uncharacterized protein BBOV_IV010210 [Babesia bovis T2Bo]|uniref:Membrane protein, putative n=1 Tax=Babesia bovis TaxID=5865 RepID=A7AS56_BABBO|nr:uncharacterized protein BBOV_IV010210 [Babesia bovis T2Bo]EDO07375.1 putative integral membrane protein [Babesia bovis T2Bo]|eukprot:XP_001610943.1 hypothetical protein [Babesia bovis T2Bo]
MQSTLMLHIYCFTTLFIIPLIVDCNHRFLRWLDINAYHEVSSRLLKFSKVGCVLPLDKHSYRNLVLPGNSHFRSVVLFYDNNELDDRLLLNTYRMIGCLFKDNWNNVNSSGHPLYFFSFKVNDNDREWLYHLHNIKNTPDLIRFDLGRSITNTGQLRVDIFTKLLANKTDKNKQIEWDSLYYLLIEFCQRPFPATEPTTNKTNPLLYVSALILKYKYLCTFLCFIVLLLCAICVYKTRWLMAIAAISAYVLSTMCIPASFRFAKSYGGKLLNCSKMDIKCIMGALFLDSTKMQYFYEGVIFQIMLLLLSFLIFKMATTESAFMSICSLVIAMLLSIQLLSILKHKNVPFWIDFKPPIYLTRSRFTMTRDLLL